MATARKPKIKANSSNFEEVGEYGVSHYSGFIYDEEKNPFISQGKWIDIANKMYREEVSAKAAFYLSTLPVLLASWQMGFPDDGKGDQEVLDYANKIFKKTSKSWHQSLQEIVFYLLWGHFGFEKVFKIEEKKVWLEALAPRRPNNNSRFILDDNGDLLTYRQWAMDVPNNGFKYFDIPAEKLVLFVNDNMFGNNYEGISALRSAYRPYLIKQQLVEADKLRHYRFSSPIPVFEEPEDELAKDEDIRRENREIVKSMARKFRSGRHTYAIIPNGWDFKLVQPDPGTDTTLRSIKYHDNQIFLSVLTNIAGMGSTQTATQGLGETMTALAAMGPTNIAKYIGDKITNEVVKPLVDMNFGKQEFYPQFFASNVRQSTIDDIVPFVVSAVQGGGISKDLSVENFLRDFIGIKKITQEEHQELREERRRDQKKSTRSLRTLLSPKESVESKQLQPSGESENE